MDPIGLISLILSIIFFIFGIGLPALQYPKNRELVYRAILKLYPRRFQEEHGAEMLHTVMCTSDQRVKAYGPLGGFFLILSDIFDISKASINVRIEYLKAFTQTKIADINRDTQQFRQSNLSPINIEPKANLYHEQIEILEKQKNSLQSRLMHYDLELQNDLTDYNVKILAQLCQQTAIQLEQVNLKIDLKKKRSEQT